MAELVVNLIGEFKCRTVDGRDVTPLGKRAAAVLAYLILRPGGQASRDELVQLLWGRSFHEQARASLRQALAAVRRSVGPLYTNIIDAGRDLITVDLSLIEVDLFLLANDEGRAANSVNTTPSPPLLLTPSLQIKEYIDWISAERMRWQPILDPQPVIVERSLEEVAFSLQPPAPASINPNIFSRFDLTPDRARRPPVVFVPVPRHTVDSDPFGVTRSIQEEFLNGLVRSRHIRMIEGNTGDLLIDGFTLTSSQRVQSDAVTLTLRLADGTTREQLIVITIEWRIGMTSVDLELEISRACYAIEHAVNHAMTGDANADLDPFALCLRAEELKRDFDPAGLAQARALFERALAIAPKFGRAYQGLTDLELTQPRTSPSAVLIDERTETALSYARTAVSLDPWDARAKLALGWAYLVRGLHDAAASTFAQAVRANPRDPDVLISAAEASGYLCMPEKSLEYGLLAIKIHPAPPDYYYHYMASAFANAGLFDRALDFSRMASLRYAEHIVWRAVISQQLGREDEAQANINYLLKDTTESHVDRPVLHRWLDRIVLVTDTERRRSLLMPLQKLIV